MIIKKKRKGFQEYLIAFLSFVAVNLDNVTAISLSIIGATIATFGGKLEYAVAATATSLALLALSSIKDKAVREQVSTELIRIKSLLQQSKTDISADKFFTKRTGERETIFCAEKELLIIQETGRLIAETCRQELLLFLRKGGLLRWIAVLDSPEIAELMAFRNANLNTDEMLERMRSGVTMLEVLAREARDDACRIQVRFFKYPADITAVFKDPYHNNFASREAIIRLQCFQVTYDGKPDFRLNYVDSKSTFDLFMQQAENIWRFSSKCILLTGPPAVGKSTVMKKVVEELSSRGRDNLLGFVTNDIKQNGSRIGFQTYNIKSPDSREELATKTNGSYTLNKSTMDNLLIPILEEGLNVKNKILIIDEIGPIQLQSKEFQSLIQEIIEDHNITVFGSVALAGHPFLSRIHNSLRTEVMEVNTQNRASLVSHLVQEFTGKL